MKPVSRRVLYLAIFLLGLAWTVLSRPAAGVTTSGQIPAPQVGFAAPAFTLAEQNGQSVSLSDTRGKVVILNYWASWCPPCRAEMPAIQQVYQSYQARGLIVLAINASNQDRLAAMQAFLGSFAHSYPILLDTNGEAGRLYAVNSLPTTFFIGRDGMIQDLVVGRPLTVAGLSSRVEVLLQEKP
ncbi:MAG TPA: redoxin domain-containing protein [Anaerolineales bacterium]|nr:redoxin domain-containing protein [Anaerolineales bacterium]